MTNSTTHPFTAEQMMAFCDGELSAAESQEVVAHIAICPECADQVSKFREISQALSRWTVPPLPREAGESVKEDLRGLTFSRKGRKGAARKGHGGGWHWRPWAMGGAGTVVATMLLLAVGLLVSRHSDEARSCSNQMSEAMVAQGSNAGGDQANSANYTRNGAMNALVGAAGSTPVSDFSSPAPAPLIARSVTFSIMAKDVNTARAALDAILARYHGYAAQITVDTPADGSPSLHASLRIPVSNLAAAIGDLRGLGRVLSESESGEDVTQQHVDLDQRLKTAHDTEDRFRAILQQRTGNLSDVLEVEEEIARVRGEIESMEAEESTLNHRVDFASIDLSVSEEYSVSIATGSAPLSLRMHNAFVAGYRNAAGALVGIFLFLIAYGPVILIWIAVVAAPVILLRRRYRRIRAKM